MIDLGESEKNTAVIKKFKKKFYYGKERFGFSC